MADELERALLLRDLELMGQPRNPNAVQPGRAGLLDVGVGLPERLSLLNQIFNPVEAIGQSMNAGERMMSPNMGVMDRLAALGDMASGIAGVVAPVAAASRAGTPAATALMEGLLGGSPTQQAAADMARGFVTDESGALRLYHGSPHDFDRFSMSKIGTGEGAQAYGQGLYFAENEGIARGYRDELSPSLITVDGRVVESPVTRAAAQFSPSPDDYIKALMSQRDRSVRNLESATSDPELGDMMADIYRSDIAEVDAKIAELQPLRGGWFSTKPGGRMYEVNVNANPEDFINYDAPLSAQPFNVQRQFGYVPRPTPQEEIAAYELAKRESPNDIGSHPAVQGIYSRQSGADAAERNFQRQVTGGGIDEAARIALSEAGIPGIRYLDAGSRNPQPNWRMLTPEESTSGKWVVGTAPNGPNKYFEDPDEARAFFEANKPPEPTRNYVIFDENLINIVRKYGIAGAAAMLGVSAFDVEQAMAQGQQQPQGLLSTGVQ